MQPGIELRPWICDKGNMVKSRALLTTSILAALFAGALSSCSGKQVDPTDPASLFQEAEEEIKSDHYLIALERLRAIKNKFPYSNYSVEAQLRIADVYFLQESYPEAAASYESFRELHPKHEKVPYAMFQAAKSYFNDIPGKVARDLGAGQRALLAYQEFLAKFPNDPLVKGAREDIATTRNLLAEKEMDIGDFYSREKHYDSAISRYKKAISLYPDTPAAKQAEARLERAEKMLEKSSNTTKEELR
jgi:outer membrane protein assembly factor BamD